MSQDKELSHLDTAGNAHMVDVSDKQVSQRQATAVGSVFFPPPIYQKIRAVDGMTKKGSIEQIARIAGIMGAKKTADLIPLCHPLPLDKVGVDIHYNDTNNSIDVTTTAKVTHKTGVEMEALTAVSVACLTIYDMTKALSHDITISELKLLHKTGGKSTYRAPQ